METLPMDSPSNLWTTICNQFQTFLAKLPAVLPLKVSLSSVSLSLCASFCGVYDQILTMLILLSYSVRWTQA